MEYKEYEAFSKKESIKIVLIFLFGYSLLQMLFLILNNSALFYFSDETMLIVQTIVTYVFVFVATALICIVAKKQLKIHITQFGLDFKKNSILILVGVVLMFLTVIGFDWIIYIFSLYDAPVVATQNIPFIYQMIGLVTLIFLTPIMEETVFRGVVIPGLERKTNWIIAVFIVNSFFAVMHVYSIGFIFFPMYLVLGIILSLAYRFSNNNLVVTILIHLLFNLLMIV